VEGQRIAHTEIASTLKSLRAIPENPKPRPQRGATNRRCLGEVGWHPRDLDWRGDRNGCINLIIAECLGWLPWLAEQIIKRASRVLPSDVHIRYEAEWLAELDALPGHGVSRIIFAIRLLHRAPRVGRALRGIPQPRALWSAICSSVRTCSARSASNEGG
jgi:hypothetical protein